ncbi:MAG: methylenetetrahydrofolate reductase [Pseudomonadota bacterium]
MVVPQLSFEVFPPRSLKAAFDLWDTRQALSPFAPDFFSVTYGAGGSAVAQSEETLQALRSQNSGTEGIVAHITSAGASEPETLAFAIRQIEAGQRDFVALRGDVRKGVQSWASAPDLISHLKGLGAKRIFVAGYPEVHPEAASPQADLDQLKAKLDAGADEIITQFVFEPEAFLRWRDRVRSAGITAPIRAGILPIKDWRKAKGFAARCGATWPAELDLAFTHAQRCSETKLLAVAQAAELCDKLLIEGQSALHIYTLNSADLTRQVLLALGCAPKTKLLQAA